MHTSIWKRLFALSNGAIHRKSPLSINFKRRLQHKAANADPIIKERLDKELRREMDNKILRLQSQNPRDREAIPITESLSDVSDEVRVVYLSQRDILLKKFMRPSYLAFKGFCNLVKSKDEAQVLKDLVRLIYWSGKPLQDGETTAILNSLMKCDEAGMAVEMLLNRNEFCLQPSKYDLIALAEYFRDKCLACFDTADEKGFQGSFSNLLQLFPLFPDYNAPIPRAVYRAVYEVASSGVAEAQEVATGLARDFLKSKRKLALIDCIYLAKGSIISASVAKEKDDEMKVMENCLKWTEMILSMRKDGFEISEDESFMVDLMGLIHHGALADKVKGAGNIGDYDSYYKALKPNFIPSDSILLRGSTEFLEASLKIGMNERFSPEEKMKLAMICKKDRFPSSFSSRYRKDIDNLPLN